MQMGTTQKQVKSLKLKMLRSAVNIIRKSFEIIENFEKECQEEHLSNFY